MAKKIKFEMGPLQKFWVASLRKHPERQRSGRLGSGNTRNYEACCLGELHICSFRIQKKKLPFIKGGLYDESATNLLEFSFEKYGLISKKGEINGRKLKGFSSLANANDGGISWIEIADFIEKYPEAVFTKSV